MLAWLIRYRVSVVRLHRLSVMLLAVFLISGCVRVSTHTTQASYNQLSPASRQAAAANIRSWNIRGAFSIIRNQKALLANYQWQQNGRYFTINIAGALNIAASVIQGRPGSVTLRQSATKVFHARSAEILMQQQLGWYVPVSYLQYWIRGIAAPGKYQARFDRYGHLLWLRQLGWTITFSKFQTIRGIDLPKMLRLNRKNLKVKLVVKQWQLS